ncbi:hypothetical protein F2Q70_00036515 [Brassica cretica]|uniref:F-box associated beta-propeller type 3 domain-containing protein n=1 Tax=Brassica cretica TaxID=69181 RepID=A0A8S9JUP7_BRACR|nr:hypothetical protein F2Q70_00036515 [Brassica cretica]
MIIYIVNKENQSELQLLSSSPCPDSDRSVSLLDQDLNVPLVELELPTITHEYVWNNFGHDPVQDEYKVLNIAWELSNDKGKSSDIQIQVSHIGPQATWRNTQSDVIPVNLPLDNISHPHPHLMNYGGKIAVFEYSHSLLATNGSVDLWTMEDAKKIIWSNKKSFVLPVSQMNFVICSHLLMQGPSIAVRFGWERRILIGLNPYSRSLMIWRRIRLLQGLKRIHSVTGLEKPIPCICIFGMTWKALCI